MPEPMTMTIALTAMTAALLAPGSLLFVPEGHVAVFYRAGRLLDETRGPGVHVKAPLFTRHEFVQTTLQTDKVLDIPCGTQGGTLIHFSQIEVVNRLAKDKVLETVKNYTTHYDKTWIYDKIHYEVNQICSRSTLEEMYITKFDLLDETLRDALQKDIDLHAPGINIIAIRVTKPVIPDVLRANYEKVESERTKLQMAEQTQRVVEKQAETEKRKALIEAEKLAAVERVQLEQNLQMKRNEQEIADIQNAMHTAKAAADADAEFYRMSKEAEANKLLLTPEMLKLESLKAIANNTKIYYGDKLPGIYAGVATGMVPGLGSE
jgi:regulator of protease activity HflC (stomatin/prohibitin superfamily)